MSPSAEPDSPKDSMFQPWVEFWSSYAQHATSNVAATMAAEGSPDPAAMRRIWLDAMGESMEAYLRSPLFLQMLKSHIDSLIAMRRWSNTSAASGSEGMADFERRLQALENALQDRFQQLDARMASIEARLANGEATS